MTLTSINRLTNHILDCALVGNGHVLLGDRSTSIISTLRLVHGTLKSITLPAKHVIGMSSVPTGTLETPYEGVSLACSPKVVELGGIPDSLINDLWGADWMRCGARAGIKEAVLGNGVIHV